MERGIGNRKEEGESGVGLREYTRKREKGVCQLKIYISKYDFTFTDYPFVI